MDAIFQQCFYELGDSCLFSLTDTSSIQTSLSLFDDDSKRILA
jgi:hypothetical protein